MATDDLDALLAILDDGSMDADLKAVHIVDSLRPLVERCKLAEADLSVLKNVWIANAELTRQRDELLTALRFVEDFSRRIDQPSLTQQVRIALKSVEGGTDGT